MDVVATFNLAPDDIIMIFESHETDRTITVHSLAVRLAVLEDLSEFGGQKGNVLLEVSRNFQDHKPNIDDMLAYVAIISIRTSAVWDLFIGNVVDSSGGPSKFKDFLRDIASPFALS